MFLQQSHKYDDVDWPCELKSKTFIDGQLYYETVFDAIYVPAEDVDDKNEDVSYLPRKSEVETLKEVASEAARRKKVVN